MAWHGSFTEGIKVEGWYRLGPGHWVIRVGVTPLHRRSLIQGVDDLLEIQLRRNRFFFLTQHLLFFDSIYLMFRLGQSMHRRHLNLPEFRIDLCLFFLSKDNLCRWELPISTRNANGLFSKEPSEALRDFPPSIMQNL